MVETKYALIPDENVDSGKDEPQRIIEGIWIPLSPFMYVPGPTIDLAAHEESNRADVKDQSE